MGERKREGKGEQKKRKKKRNKVMKCSLYFVLSAGTRAT